MLLRISRKIKVAEVITRLDWGGSPDIVRIICNYLDHRNYDLRLISGSTEFPSAKTIEFLKNFKHRVTIIPNLKRNVNAINDLLALIKLFFLFRREKFDIVHTHTAKAGALGRIAAHLCGIPVIIHTPHGHNFYGYFNPIFSKIVIAIERFLAHFTDKIIALTELEQRDYLRFKIATIQRISLIYPGLDLGKYAEEEKNTIQIKQDFNIGVGENVIGMIARLESIKGPEYFVEAAKEVAARLESVKFIVVGEGSLRKRLESRVKELELSDKFIFSGWSEDIPQILSILDILVLPSLNEAVGMVLIEAQAQGVPVVATDVGGIPEIIKDNETAVLVPPRDFKELAEAIISLLKDSKKREKMAVAGRDWVRDKFGTEEMMHKTTALYKELIRARFGVI